MTFRFPRPDYSRVPYEIYHDPEIYRVEQQRIFQGRTWLFLGLAAEIPQPGDFRTSFLGDTPVVFNRGPDGRVHAFVNRCSHRGAIVCREKHGNARAHVCIYHRWSYDLEGNLVAVPFEKGVEGKGGGLPADFDKRDHGLQKLRVESLNGLLFVTFAHDMEPLENYLGAFITDHLRRLFREPVRVLGYQRQRVKGNWKLYTDNLRDNYHPPLLHEFHGTFAVSRTTLDGGSRMDDRHRHQLTYAIEGTDSLDATKKGFGEVGARNDRPRLKDELLLLDFRPEFQDGWTLAICSFFPNAAFQQVRNSFACRQIRTRGVGEFELFWTFFGYEADTEEMTERRLKQANMVGPGGYVSMEDGEAIEIVHVGTNATNNRHSVVELGGKGPIVDKPFRVNEVAVRGFWSFYAELMGMEPPGAEH